MNGASLTGGTERAYQVRRKWLNRATGGLLWIVIVVCAYAEVQGVKPL
ncbi:hypothetical protein OIB37_17755 [Streptomyces sp. NBC_00820]|nr:hypothetical protein OIB37_17755 [Streptomyces sp. NBC_00820]